MSSDETYDAIVIGGGPAGLSAALWLARYQRRVRVFDSGDPRNAVTWGVHGYLGLEDPKPAEVRRVGREQAIKAGAEIEAATVERIEGESGDFLLTLSDDRTVRARRILLATGLKDIVPEVEGLDEYYGTSIWHCPDCDGPEVRGKEVGIIGWGTGIAKFCMYILTWTDRLTVYTHSHPSEMSAPALDKLDEFNIPIRREAIVKLEGENGCLKRVVLHDGSTHDVDAMFFHIAVGPGSTLAADLGCELEEGAEMEGILKIDKEHQTTVPGIYAAGDITPGSRLAIRAAAEGARAGLGIHKSLIPDSRRIG
jgi:thioredoxin reductase